MILSKTHHTNTFFLYPTSGLKQHNLNSTNPINKSPLQSQLHFHGRGMKIMMSAQNNQGDNHQGYIGKIVKLNSIKEISQGKQQLNEYMKLYKLLQGSRLQLQDPYKYKNIFDNNSGLNQKLNSLGYQKQLLQKNYDKIDKIQINSLQYLKKLKVFKLKQQEDGTGKFFLFIGQQYFKDALEYDRTVSADDFVINGENIEDQKNENLKQQKILQNQFANQINELVDELDKVVSQELKIFIEESIEDSFYYNFDRQNEELLQKFRQNYDQSNQDQLENFQFNYDRSNNDHLKNFQQNSDQSNQKQFENLQEKNDLSTEDQLKNFQFDYDRSNNDHLKNFQKNNDHQNQNKFQNNQQKNYPSNEDLLKRFQLKYDQSNRELQDNFLQSKPKIIDDILVSAEYNLYNQISKQVKKFQESYFQSLEQLTDQNPFINDLYDKDQTQPIMDQSIFNFLVNVQNIKEEQLSQIQKLSRKHVKTFFQQYKNQFKDQKVNKISSSDFKLLSEGDKKQAALDYHEFPVHGKYKIVPTKPMDSQVELSLAYSPGVAEPCKEIKNNPELAYKYTNKGNMVAVISNGTAVLGLGNLGAIAGKPVMEGKSVLFKKFAGVDSIDLCVDAENPDDFINCVKYLAPSFGGINLEDIKGPDCFYIEEKLKQIMPIPIFHDDQHGTAIVALAGLINSLEITGKNIQDIKVVCSGAGAAGIALMKLFQAYGVKKENQILCDKNGVVYKGRKKGMNEFKEQFQTEKFNQNATLEEACKGADVLIGVSGPGQFTDEVLKNLNENPIIFAMANPEPEIRPELAKKIRPDCIIATGRSDYPNQINNVMCFPFLFRATLDVRASQINESMKMAAAKALAALTREPVPVEVKNAYPQRSFEFGREYIIPTPFDPRLIENICIEVAKAAEESGIAKNPIKDYENYRIQLRSINNQS